MKGRGEDQKVEDEEEVQREKVKEEWKCIRSGSYPT